MTADKLIVVNEGDLNIKKVQKVVLTMGGCRMVNDAKALEEAFKALYKITGQRPHKVKAKKSEAGFKVRKGMGIGVKVTLRKVIMDNFLKVLVNIVLPRERNFRGFSRRQITGKAFAFGFNDLGIFPQMGGNDSLGMNIVIVTNARDETEAEKILCLYDIPFLS